MKRGQYIFTLDGISYKSLMQDYFLNTTSDQDQNIVNLNIRDNKKKIFYDVNKNKIVHWVTMVDYLDHKALPETTEKPCWWCRYEFETMPIGCPVKYRPNTVKGKNLELMEYLDKKGLDERSDDYFETDGIFCSFPCCKSYILNNRYNSIYKQSSILLTSLYEKLYGVVIDIPSAPSWKILEKSCGPMPIDKYRKSFGKFEFNETPNIKRPFMYTTGTYISEMKGNKKLQEIET